MFAAVGLFVLMLLAMLYLAFIRFRNPPRPVGAPPAVGAVESPPAPERSRWLATGFPHLHVALLGDSTGRATADA